MERRLFKCCLPMMGALVFTLASYGTEKTDNGRLISALSNSAWNASQWISAANAPVVKGSIQGANERAADGASWFVSAVKNEQKVVSAKWMTAGLGVYELYVNGKPIGDEILKPGFTHYKKTKRSFTYDVTSVLNASKGAENVFSAQVTPGWWADKIVTPGGHDGMIGKKPAFRGVIELTFSDGTKKYYGTDTENWKSGVAGPVKHAAIFDGEEYDAREQPGYKTIDKLSTPELNTEFDGEVVPTNGAEIYRRTDLALSPVKAYTWKDIEGANAEEYGKVVVSKTYKNGEAMVIRPGENLVVDFGQN